MQLTGNKIKNLFACLIVISVSCNKMPEKRLSELTTLKKTLENSKENNKNHSASLYKKFEEKLYDPFTKLRAERWRDKVFLLRESSIHLNKFIDSLKFLLLSRSNQSANKLRDYKAVEQIFTGHQLCDSLYGKMFRYKKELIDSDDEVREIFINDVVIPESDLRQIIDRAAFLDVYFKDKSTLEVMVNLSLFQNNAVIFENRLIQFFDNKTTSYRGDYYDVFSSIVGQSSNYLRPGDKLTITAGVGAFSTRANAQITIGNKRIEIDAGGVAVTTVKTPSMPGKYKTPVTITFTKPDGVQETKTYDVDYNVVAW